MAENSNDKPPQTFDEMMAAAKLKTAAAKVAAASTSPSSGQQPQWRSGDEMLAAAKREAATAKTNPSDGGPPPTFVGAYPEGRVRQLPHELPSKEEQQRFLDREAMRVSPLEREAAISLELKGP